MRDVTNTGLEFIVLALRIALIFFLYMFLFQILRVVGRELRTLGAVAGGGAVAGRPGSGPGGRLTLLTPGQTGLVAGHVFMLSPVNTIGRRPDSDIPLNDTFVSAEHTLLEWRGTSWWVEDLGSTNGTWVNDIEVTSPTPVSYGDVVRVGRIEVKLGR